MLYGTCKNVSIQYEYSSSRPISFLLVIVKSLRSSSSVRRFHSYKHISLTTRSAFVSFIPQFIDVTELWTSLPSYLSSKSTAQLFSWMSYDEINFD